MPNRPPPFGSDTIALPAYFASSSGNDPGLAQWKQEHPEWFEAGTWAPAVRPRRKSGVMSRNARPASAEWMRETRNIERQQQERGRAATEAEWLDSALRAATFAVGLNVASAPSANRTLYDGDDGAHGPYKVYIPTYDHSTALFHLAGYSDDEIKRRIQEASDRIHAIADTAL